LRRGIRLPGRSLRENPDSLDTAPSPGHRRTGGKRMSHSLFAELKRRDLFEAGAPYLASAGLESR